MEGYIYLPVIGFISRKMLEWEGLMEDTLFLLYIPLYSLNIL